jgi:hypothetical protein
MAIGESAGLLFRIKADSSQAKNEINDLQRLVGASSTGIGSSLSSIAGPATIAAGAVTAIASAAVGATLALFNLSKSTAEFGSEIFDASQKTGLGATTLSALKFAADQSGSSFEQLTKGITVFGTEIGKAADGNEKAQEKMKALGVTSTDLDTALKQVFKTIIEGKSDTERLALASEAFGKKIGPDLIPLIKDTNGNLDELVRRAKELGVTIDDEAAAAADEFGDSLDTLSAQLAGVGRTIGTDSLPAFTNFFRQVSTYLSQNKGEVAVWSQTIAQALAGMLELTVDAARGWSVLASAVGDMSPVLRRLLIDLNPVVLALRYIASRGQQALDREGRRPSEGGGGGANIDFEASPTTGPSGRSPRAVRDTSARDAERDRREEERAIEQARRERIAAARQLFEEETSLFEAGVRHRIAVVEQFAEAEKRSAADVAKFREDRELEVLTVRKDEFEKYLAVLKKDGTSAQIQGAINDLKILEEEIATVRAENAKDEADRNKKAIEDIKALREERFKSWKERIEQEEEVDRLETEAADRRAREEEALRKKREQQTFDDMGGGIAGGFFGGLGLTVEKMTAEVNILSQLGDLLAQTFQQVASAVGQAVHSFVLFGSAGTSFRKFAAEVIASIAQMAVVQSVWEAAQGLAMLALAWFSGNPKYFKSATDHFLAAAAFAVIGGVAVGVGRAAAGSSFAQESGRATGGGGSGGGSDEENSELNLIDSPFRGFELRMQQENRMLRETLERTNLLLGANEEVVNNWAERLKLTSPGDVVRMGAADAADAIFDAGQQVLESDGRATTRFYRNTGQYR